MRWTRRQLLGLGALVVSGGTALTACADTVAGTPLAARSVPARPTSSRRPAARQIRVAVLDTDQHFDEIVRAVLTKVGISRIETVKTKFEQMFTIMAAKRADMAAGLYPTPQTCGRLLWSAPDHRALTALGVPPGNPKGLLTLADLQAKGATVTVMREQPEHKYLTRIGLPAKQLRAFPGPIEMLDAVTKGQADCTAFNDIGLRGMVKADLAKLDVTTGFALDGEPAQVGAFAFQPDGEFDELVEKFNAELRRMHRSGEWLRISESHGFTKENVPPPDLTVEKVCAG